jgi:hypothetical protein
MKLLKTLAASTVLASSFMGAAMAQSFECITDNSAGSCSQAEAALSWTFVGDVFTISAATGFTGNVAEVYFDIVDGSGVAVSFSGGVGNVLFTPGAAPPALPGGAGIDPVFDTDFAFDSGAGGLGQGITGGESASFTFSGLPSGDFSSVVGGIHVRSLLNGQSEGLVTTPPIPEPSTYALMLAGLAAVGFVARQRRRRQ